MCRLQRYVYRLLTSELERSVAINPVTAVIGPRQSGKSTLVRHVLADRGDTLFLDLELPSDLRKLSDPELFLREHAKKIVCIDEVQNKPDLFPVLRALVDMDRRPGRFVILGSASRDTIRQSSETLAGRIHYVELTPFIWPELEPLAVENNWNFKKNWWCGGFPPAFLSENDVQSKAWLKDLIQDFLSRDIPQFGMSVPAPTMMRFWKMLAHYHGSLLNAAKMAQALDVSHTTVHRYLDVLEQTFMVRVLRPFEINLKKRLIKSPRVYVRDSGILHSLLEIETMSELYGHPIFGASWEGWCIEQITGTVPLWSQRFYRTSSGEEIDLILERGQRRLAFEFKASLSPHLSRGFPGSLEILKPECTWIVCPMDDPGYPTRSGARITGIRECLKDLEAYA